MQATEAENNAASCSDESINFRPSPNFKHMKKYLKSKFEEMNALAANGMSESISHEEQENEAKATTNKNIQPPLPPNPPPPDSPLSKIKQEVEDDDYQCSNTVGYPDLNTKEEQTLPATNETTAAKPEPIMCRNFVRGACKKGSECIFVHELILSQLPGVYTFCRNFQNKQCVYTKCKFVHASVFEKENFYRTGYLPPHATAHMRQEVTHPPPPPPPAVSETMQVVPQGLTSTSAFDPSVAPVPAMGCQTVPSINVACPTVPTLSAVCPVVSLSANNGPEMYRVIPNNSKSPLKREWNETEDVSRSPHNLENIEALAKKCKNCEANEFRYQYMKNKVEKMVQCTQEQNQQITELTKKYQTICAILRIVLKSSNLLEKMNF